MTYLPTEEQLEKCQWIVMTSDAEWDKYARIFANNEDVYTNVKRGLIDGENFDGDGNRIIAAGATSNRRSSINAVGLGRRWGISQSLAAMTLQAITTRVSLQLPTRRV
jgi:hypothetical protein